MPETAGVKVAVLMFDLLLENLVENLVRGRRQGIHRTLAPIRISSEAFSIRTRL